MTKYAWILNRNTARKVKWEDWGYQLELLEHFLLYPELVICKARQLGITWLLAGYAVWKALFSDGAKILIMSGNEDKAWDVKSKCLYIWKNLPEFLQVPLIHEGRGWMDFENGSEIRAIPSTERAGAGTDATLVIRDELREHPCGHQNFVAISPCIDSGGQIIDLSTYDKYTPLDKNHFAQRVEKAMTGSTKVMSESGIEFYDGIEHAKLIFVGWKLRPVRSEGLTLEEWWDREIVPKYTPQDREQEYPETLEEAIRPPVTTAYFDVQSLNDMLYHVSEPLDVREINTYNGSIQIWKKPLIGRDYIVFTDPSDGYDPFASVVMDGNTSEWVAIATGKMKADEVARVHDELVRYYNDAFNDGETNARAGGKFIKTLQDLDTPNMAPRRDTSGNIVKGKGGEILYGWYTTPEHRKIMLDDYEPAIRTGQVAIHYRPAIDQHRYFIKDDQGKLRASTGHDDFVMAGAGAWNLQKYLPSSQAIKIRTFIPGRR